MRASLCPVVQQGEAWTVCESRPRLTGVLFTPSGAVCALYKGLRPKTYCSWGMLLPATLQHHLDLIVLERLLRQICSCIPK